MPGPQLTAGLALWLGFVAARDRGSLVAARRRVEAPRGRGTPAARPARRRLARPVGARDHRLDRRGAGHLRPARSGSASTSSADSPCRRSSRHCSSGWCSTPPRSSAEVVRGGIQAVRRGQLEAARALGLSEGDTLRLIVFPQALRIIVPPLTSQYLNLVKNSSLAIAIGYPDLFKVGQTMANQTGQPVPVIILVMGDLPRDQPRHVAAHEPLQPPRPGAGAMTARDAVRGACRRRSRSVGPIGVAAPRTCSRLGERPADGRCSVWCSSWLAAPVGQWAVTEARWSVITTNMRLFLIGQYPADQAWRVWLDLLIISVLGGLIGRRVRASRRARLAITLAACPAACWRRWCSSRRWARAGGRARAQRGPGRGRVRRRAARSRRRAVRSPRLARCRCRFVPAAAAVSGATVLPIVSSNLWGGLLLTFMLAMVGILLSFPLGVLLALGRRSQLPAVRILSTAYIEVVRGVPLVTILFLADIILPLFLPGEWRLDRVARAMGGDHALLGGLRGRERARRPAGDPAAARSRRRTRSASARVQMNLYIVLPQALRSVIPANVGLFISLLKDTTLVTIIGLARAAGDRARRPGAAAVVRRPAGGLRLRRRGVLRALLRDVAGELPAGGRARRGTR